MNHSDVNLSPETSVPESRRKTESTCATATPADTHGRTICSADLDHLLGVSAVAVTPATPSENVVPCDTRPVQVRWSELFRAAGSAKSVTEILRTINSALHARTYDPKSAVSIRVVAASGGQTEQTLPQDAEAAGLKLEQRAVRESLAASETILTRRDGNGSRFACCPCGTSECVIAESDAASDDFLRDAAAFSATLVSEFRTRERAQKADHESHQLAALLDLVSRVVDRPSLPDALHCLARELSDHFQASMAYVGLCDDTHGSCRLHATSSSPVVDTRSQEAQAAEAMLQEGVLRQNVTCWPPQRDDRHAMQFHIQFAKQVAAEAIVTIPCRNESGKTVGVVSLAFCAGGHNTPAPTSQNGVCKRVDAARNAARILKAGERVLASVLTAVRAAGEGSVARTMRSLRKLMRTRKSIVAAAVIAAIAAVLLIPVDYKVTCRSELQPISRRFIAAPFEAPLQECLVEPGDVVEAGQVLAVLDGRELRWELAAVRADLAKASREHDAYLSEQDSGRAAIARHEIERLQNRADLLSSRTRNLEIRSPFDGIVVAGDLRDSEGVPLETGQTLFEVAPLDRLQVDVLIPEDDIRHVRPGQTVRLRLEADPATTLSAVIRRVHPRAELREHENVFVAEADLNHQNDWLRPGMRADARVSTGRHTLGWNLFHKPVARVAAWLGW